MLMALLHLSQELDLLRFLPSVAVEAVKVQVVLLLTLVARAARVAGHVVQAHHIMQEPPAQQVKDLLVEIAVIMTLTIQAVAVVVLEELAALELAQQLAAPVELDYCLA